MLAYHHVHKEAVRAGKDAAVRERVAGTSESNPYRKQSVAHRFWEKGYTRAGELLDELNAIGR